MNQAAPRWTTEKNVKAVFTTVEIWTQTWMKIPIPLWLDGPPFEPDCCWLPPMVGNPDRSTSRLHFAKVPKPEKCTWNCHSIIAPKDVKPKMLFSSLRRAYTVKLTAPNCSTSTSVVEWPSWTLNHPPPTPVSSSTSTNKSWC